MQVTPAQTTPGSSAHIEQLKAQVPAVTKLVTPYLQALAQHNKLFVRAHEGGARYIVTDASIPPDPTKNVRLLAAGKESLVLLIPGQDTTTPILIKVAYAPRGVTEDGVAKLSIRFDLPLGRQQKDQMAGHPGVLSDRLRTLIPGAVPMIHQAEISLPNSKAGYFCLVENLCPQGYKLLEFGQEQKEGFANCEEAVLKKATNGAALLTERKHVDEILLKLDNGGIPGLMGFKCQEISLAVQVNPQGVGRLVVVDLQSAAIVDLKKLGEGQNLGDLEVPAE